MTFADIGTLHGKHAVLEPLEPGHAAGLRNAIADGELDKLWFTSVPAPADVDAYIANLLSQRQSGAAMPFAVRNARSDDIVGGTRYMNIDAPNRRLEIGGTWYAERVQRTAINTECKLMLLTHAFETLGCIAVEFRTDWFNKRSQAAILRLGAKQDALLRNHIIMPDGRVRDTVVYSIIQNEWPGVRMNLQHKLNSTPGRG